MTDREKLVDLFMDELTEDNPWAGNVKGLVDKMIAAGVTFQTWIPVTERLPKGADGKSLCEVVNTLFTDEWYSKEAMQKRGVVQIPLCFLAKSLENMSLCHAAYFCKGWESARGCKIEHDAAVAYGLEIIYEE